MIKNVLNCRSASGVRPGNESMTKLINSKTSVTRKNRGRMRFSPPKKAKKQNKTETPYAQIINTKPSGLSNCFSQLSMIRFLALLKQHSAVVDVPIRQASFMSGAAGLRLSRPARFRR